MGVEPFRSEVSLRGARMLRTALGPAIAAWLEDPGVVEVMLNPDGRLWVDRLAAGLEDTGHRLAFADGERIIRLVAVATLSDLVRSSLRLRPDRIPVGEVRGAEALELLKAWGTGRPGGIGTLHAGSALGALRRLERLIQEAAATVPRALIAQTIDVIAVLAGRGADRRLAELAEVRGLTPEGDYRVTSVFAPPVSVDSPAPWRRLAMSTPPLSVAIQSL